MNRIQTSFVVAIAFPLLLAGLITACAPDADGGAVTLEGRVVDTQNQPVANAITRATLQGDELDVTQTDDNGFYTLGFDIDETRDVEVTAARDGVNYSRTVTVFASADPIQVQDLRLSFEEEEAQVSGTPSNILLLSQSSQNIGVKESGSTEVANITFQVADSTGRPVTLGQQTPVRFKLGQQPGGGEFIAPEEAVTDNSGRVTVNLSSGTTSGVVQIVAEVDGEEGTIRSKPVSVTIHGGMPDQDHFTLGAERSNMAGLNRAGETTTVSVIVGDKFSNPVKPGTAVYFSATHGVIEGDVATNAQGQGSVTFTSANPRPSNDGIVIIEAETADENENRVWDQIPMVLSGRIMIDVEPMEAILGQTYNVTLTDELGNPLAGGTTLNVRAEGNRVQATGHTNVTLGDTHFDANGTGGGLTYDDVIRGAGITEFTFRAAEHQNVEESGESELESIAITVSGPNGSLEIVLTEDEVFTSSEDAIIVKDEQSATITLLE